MSQSILITFWPVLELGGALHVLENSDAIFQQPWDCVLCLDASILGKGSGEGSFASRSVPFCGFASGNVSLCRTGGEELSATFHQAVSQLRPTIITTAGEVPLATEISI